MIGTGTMGSAHARTLRRHVPDVRLSVVADANPERAREVARETGAAAVDNPFATIEDRETDAVVIAAPDETHCELVLACVRAGKPVLCEKPLAPDSASCVSILGAETERGTRLVSLGFMRRFDPGYAAMKARLVSGALGTPMMLRNVHRCVAAPGFFNPATTVISGAVHDFDVARWLLGAEISEVSAFEPTATAATPGSPVLLVLRTEAGHLIDIETFIDARYGYEVRCEAVCTGGTVALAHSAPVEVNAGLGRTSDHPAGYLGRFADAYRLEFLEWARQLVTGVASSVLATAWDGYAATAVAEAAITALGQTTPAPVSAMPRPEFYRR